MTIYLDRQPIKGLMDKEENVTILIVTKALLFPYLKFQTGSIISGVGRQQDSHATILLVHWKDLSTSTPFPSK